MKDKLDDEIKLAGLQALVPEELETHLILNSNRLRTFEDARLDVVTYVEDTLIRGMLTRSVLFRPAKEKGHRAHEMVVFSVVVLIFNETAMHAKATASNRLAKVH